MGFFFRARFFRGSFSVVLLGSCSRGIIRVSFFPDGVFSAFCGLFQPVFLGSFFVCLCRRSFFGIVFWVFM